MGAIMVFAGLLGGIVFGLLVAWGAVGLVVAAAGVAVLIFGSFISQFKMICGVATLGFLFSFIIAGGLKIFGF